MLVAVLPWCYDVEMAQQIRYTLRHCIASIIKDLKKFFEKVHLNEKICLRFA